MAYMPKGLRGQEGKGKLKEVNINNMLKDIFRRFLVFGNWIIIQ